MLQQPASQKRHVMVQQTLATVPRLANSRLQFPVAPWALPVAQLRRRAHPSSVSRLAVCARRLLLPHQRRHQRPVHHHQRLQPLP